MHDLCGHVSWDLLKALYSQGSNYACCSTTQKQFVQSLFNSSQQFQLRCIPPTNSPFTSGNLPALSGRCSRPSQEDSSLHFSRAFICCHTRDISVLYIFFLGNFRNFSLKKSWRQIPCNSRTGRFYPLKMGCKWRQPSTTFPSSPHIHTFPAWFLECRQRISLGI